MKKKTKSSVGNSPSFALAAGAAVSELLQRLAPPEEARRHFESARIEFLKGLRALLDARIERRSKSKPRGQAINVE